MGKASSKKVARAAATGGGARTARGGSARPWKWYVIISLVAVLGVLLIVMSRSERQEQIAEIGDPKPGDHWHVAYGINVCGAFQPEMTVERDPQGIHTHAPNGQGDGVIHIHPFTTQASGENATLGKFVDAAGLGLADGELTMPDGDVYEDGDDCNGQEGVLRIKYDDEIFTENLRDINFTADRGRLTIFFGPEDAEIPDPPSVPTLDNLSDVPPEQQTPLPPDLELNPEGTPTSPPPEGSETTAPPETTPTSGADTTAAP